MLRADSLAEFALSKNDDVWREVSKSEGKDIATGIDGVTGKRHICEMWKNHFDKLLNSVAGL